MTEPGQSDTQRYALAGVARCGCITAAFIEENMTAKARREFYRDMADTDREVRRMTVAEIKANPTFLNCEHDG